MRLKSLFVSNYKNLKNFTLSFDGTSFIDVFVGKNGSGKSNLFEALIEIFRHLDQFGRPANEISFDYLVSYEIEGQESEIEWKAGKLRINKDEDRKTLGQTPFPDNVLIYYSGHNTTVTDLIANYEEKFRGRIKGANLEDSRRFLGIGQEYKALLLAVLLVQPSDSRAHTFIRQKLKIDRLGTTKPGTADVSEPVLRVDLQRPDYARGSDKGKYDIDNVDAASRYWRPLGITKDFLGILSDCVWDNTEELTVTEGYFPTEDRYILYLSISKLQEKFAGKWQELFRQFDNLKTLGMLGGVSVPLRLASGIEASISHFSDGQFQSVYIYSIVELFKDRNCLILLDEPDAFLHPEWQFEFLRQVSDITDAAATRSHVLMSSHSAVTLISHEKKRVNLFDIYESNVACSTTSRDYAINKLSSNLIKYKEDEQILSILRNIRIEGLPVFFTEGSTDPDILKEAWRKLYDEPIPFIPIYAFCCDYLRRALQDNRIINEMGNRPLFGIFDFDEAYNEWNYLNQKDTWALQCDDPYLGLRTENATEDVHAFILPVPRIAKVEAQVMKTPGSKDHFAHQSIMGIEHLFYGDQTEQYFETKQLPGGGEIIVFSGNKTRFARDVVPTLDAASFEVLRPIFEFIKSKCAGGAPA